MISTQELLTGSLFCTSLIQKRDLSTDWLSEDVKQITAAFADR